MNPRASSGDSGFTLIEVLISVALFALIGLAGFALVQSVIGVQRRTDQRLERLADLQRAMHILTSDFEQATAGSLTRDGTTVTFRRDGGSIAYGLGDGALQRTISAGGAANRQSLLAGIGDLRWQFFLPGAGWRDDPAPAQPGDDGPLAVAVDLKLEADNGPAGLLRRVVVLPRTALP